MNDSVSPSTVDYSSMKQGMLSHDESASMSNLRLTAATGSQIFEANSSQVTSQNDTLMRRLTQGKSTTGEADDD